MKEIRPDVQRWLDLLPIVSDRRWVVKNGYKLRSCIRDQDNACPVCALINELSDTHNWCSAAHAAAQSFFEESNGVGAIMEAADYPDHPLRPHLLAALGLK